MALEDHAVSSSDWMSKSNTSLYIRRESDNPITIILYVDDLVIGGPDLAEITKIKSLLSGRFEMKDLHELHYFLGIEVIRTPVGILISQSPQLALQVRTNRVQTFVHSSRSKSQNRCRLWHGCVRPHSVSPNHWQPDLPNHHTPRPQLLSRPT